MYTCQDTYAVSLDSKTTGKWHKQEQSLLHERHHVNTLHGAERVYFFGRRCFVSKGEPNLEQPEQQK